MPSFKYLLLVAMIGIAIFFNVAIFAETYNVEPNLAYEVVTCYPHDTNAFSQGLVYHDGYLYEGTGLYGFSSLRQIDLVSGTVIKQIDLEPDFFGEGITILHGQMYQLTWRENLGFVYHLESFQQSETFSYPTEGWGLTTDGKHLIMSDGSATLTFFDPLTFEIIKQVDVLGVDGPVTRLNELEYLQGEIWANIWFRNQIVRIDPKTGRVLGWLDLTELAEQEKALNSAVDVLNGIAYDVENGRIFVTGKLWSKVYEIRLLE